MAQPASLIYPPGPSSILSVKTLHELIDDPLKTLSNIAKKYGEISHFKIGSRHVYLINNPDYIEKILIYNHQNFKKGNVFKLPKNCWEKD